MADPSKPEDDADRNRGQRAPQEGSDDVAGSGAGAGGGGGSEDFDADPVGGGGAVRIEKDRAVSDSGADAPVHGSR